MCTRVRFHFRVRGIRRNRVKGEVRVYHAGESWSEPRGARYPVSRNASKTEPAKPLAVCVVDSNDKELTTRVT
jgi:hypothetical protein